MEPIMPKAVAVWLIDNTSLTFKQIADFCNLHELEVENIANEDNSKGLKGINPILTGETTQAEIDKCQKDPNISLTYLESKEYNQHIKKSNSSNKQSKFKRKNKLDSILWIISHYPNVADTDLSKTFSIAVNIIKSIRAKSYWNYKNLVAKNPVTLGLCKEEELRNLMQSHLTTVKGK